jgi:iron(III) transport system substrate-binding protein
VKKTSWFVLFVLGGVVAAAWWRFHIPSGTQDVVVYVSHDEVFSEPILKDFEIRRRRKALEQ